MNHEDIERMFSKVNLYLNRSITFDKEMKQAFRRAERLFHEEKDNVNEQCEMDEETARAKGIL